MISARAFLLLCLHRVQSGILDKNSCGVICREPDAESLWDLRL